jgi:hypothetical protein
MNGDGATHREIHIVEIRWFILFWVDIPITDLTQ